jgi:hypothetical protein
VCESMRRKRRFLQPLARELIEDVRDGLRADRAA